MPRWWELPLNSWIVTLKPRLKQDLKMNEWRWVRVLFLDLMSLFSKQSKYGDQLLYYPPMVLFSKQSKYSPVSEFRWSWILGAAIRINFCNHTLSSAKGSPSIHEISFWQPGFGGNIFINLSCKLFDLSKKNNPGGVPSEGVDILPQSTLPCLPLSQETKGHQSRLSRGSALPEQFFILMSLLCAHWVDRFPLNLTDHDSSNN